MFTMPSHADATLAGLDDAAALRSYVRTGDPRAFEVLSHRYHAMVLATCRRTLGSEADAEDAAQETFLRLARGAHRIRSNVAAWLHACAVGASIDLIRRSSARSRAEGAAASHRQGLALDDPAQGLWSELEPLIDQALAELADEDRQLIVARYLAGRPQVELAADMGLSEGAVSRRLSKALDRLRGRLGKSGLVVAGGATLAAALQHATSGLSIGAAPAHVGKIAIAGIGVQQSKGTAVLGTAALTVAAGAAATIGSLLLTPSGGAGQPGNNAPMPVLAGATSQVATGPARPRGRLGQFQMISAYDEDFNASGTFITDDGIAIRRGMEPESGKPRRIRLDISRSRQVEDDPKTDLREVAELDVRTARVLPESDEWARFRRGQNLTLQVGFDEFDRLVIREKDGLVQIGKNEPDWYGVRPPPGWDQRDEIPEDAGPLGILGPWTESERIIVRISGEEIRFGPDSWNAGRYRVIEWTQMDGYSRVQSIQAGGRDPRLIGTRFKLLIREVEGGYEIAYYPPSTGRSNRWPRSFEYALDNPIRLVKLGSGG
ncbi:MAG: RNA polymerase sigma factor [Phycisphaerales bacterium]|jgi:RNA polymerase sigma factor (sigma-70 family)